MEPEHCAHCNCDDCGCDGCATLVISAPLVLSPPLTVAAIDASPAVRAIHPPCTMVRVELLSAIDHPPRLA